MRSKKALINILFTLTLQLLTIVCGFIVPKLIIQKYGSSVNGLVSSITNFLAFITLLESGFGPVVKSVLYKPIAQKNKNEIEKILKTSENFFRAISKIFIVYIVFLCIIYPYIVSSEFDTIYTISLIIIMAISTFTEYYFGMTYKLYLQAEQKTYITSVIQIGILVVNTTIIVCLMRFNVSIHFIKMVTAIIYVVRPILQNIYVKRKYKIDIKNVKENAEISQKWDGLAQHLAYTIHNNTDVVVLTIFANTTMVSIYSVYRLIINGVNNIINSFISGVSDSFGDMIAKNENVILNKNFKIYELFYFTVCTIIFSSTLILIIPFVKVYTKGINDANYIVPLFGYIYVIAEFIWSIRRPYNELVKVAGHFKQTMPGAWIEAFTNIIISILLVVKYGIVGVAIGTLISITIRTFEYMFYATKNILKRDIKYTFIRLFVICTNVITINFLCHFINVVSISNYFQWFGYAIIVVCISSTITIIFNTVIYYKETKEMIKKVVSILNIRKKLNIK